MPDEPTHNHVTAVWIAVFNLVVLFLLLSLAWTSADVATNLYGNGSHRLLKNAVDIYKYAVLVNLVIFVICQFNYHSRYWFGRSVRHIIGVGAVASLTSAYLIQLMLQKTSVHEIAGRWLMTGLPIPLPVMLALVGLAAWLLSRQVDRST